MTRPEAADSCISPDTVVIPTSIKTPMSVNCTPPDKHDQGQLGFGCIVAGLWFRLYRELRPSDQDPISAQCTQTAKLELF
jgi:hypothetical protein